MKAKEDNGVAVSDVPENGQEDKKYWISEDPEASRNILRAVSSGVADLLDLSESEDAALAHCCSTERLEAALTGGLTVYTDRFRMQSRSHPTEHHEFLEPWPHRVP